MIGTPIRCVQGAPVTVSYSPVDADGEPSGADPGTVTVGVTRADGTEVVAPLTATSGSGAAARTYTLTAVHTVALDHLQVTWSSATAILGRQTVEVVGNVYAPLAEIRTVESSLADTALDLDAALLRARGEVEQMVERACGHVMAFVPRFATATVSHPGTPSLRLPHYMVRRVRWVKYGSTSNQLVDFTGYDLSVASLPEPSGMVAITGGSWPYGRLLVGYEHGFDAPPDDLKRAAVQAIRRFANRSKSAVDPRAISYTGPSGEVQRFPTPGLGPWVTGVPEIDEVLAWYKDHYPVLALA